MDPIERALAVRACRFELKQAVARPRKRLQHMTLRLEALGMRPNPKWKRMSPAQRRRVLDQATRDNLAELERDLRRGGFDYDDGPT